jgi:hypothetical protein
LLGVTHSNTCCAHWLESNASAPHLGNGATRNSCKTCRKVIEEPCERTLQADVQVRSCTHPGRGKTEAEALQPAHTGAAAHLQRDLQESAQVSTDLRAIVLERARYTFTLVTFELHHLGWSYELHR